MSEATLIARSNPFCQRPEVMPVRAGRTILQILTEFTDGAELVPTLRVDINGQEVPAMLWDKVKPKAGTQIAVTVFPAGGSDSSRKWIRAVLMVVVIAVAWAAAPAVAGAMGLTAAGTTAMVASGLTMLGTAAVNALVPPPKAKLAASEGGGATERQFALTGTSNATNPYGVIPLVIGEMRYFPPHAVLPYTEEDGDGQYLRMMLDLGHGVFDVSDIRIGETPIGSYEGVEYEITKTPTLYTDDIFEEAVGATLNDNDTVTRTTQVQTEEIGVVIDFNGLFGMNNKGAVVQVTGGISFQYRAVGAGSWTDAPITAGRAMNWEPGTNAVRTGRRDPFTVSVSWKVPAGQYEVKIFRAATNWNGADANSRVGDAQVSVLRSIKPTNPSTTGTTKLAMRIKASDQLNGTVQTLNLLQRQQIPVLASGVWTAQYTKNPAWIALWLMTSGALAGYDCAAVPIRLPIVNVDLQAFEDWAAYCTARELECSLVLDGGTTLMELIDDVMASGMASRSMRDGKVSVVFEDPAAQPVGMFTPANSESFSGQRTFFDMAHALRVKFTNPDQGFITDEIVVLDDLHSFKGKNARGVASGLPAATRFETMDLRAGCSAQAAWRMARYQLAQALYRPNNYTLETDIEMLRYTRGDVLVVADDVVEWGEGWGRIKTIAGNVITLDETITLGGGSYSARVTLSDGSLHVRNVTPGSSETNTFTLASSVTGIEVGNLVVIGSTLRQTRNLIVTGIAPSADLKATMRLADHAPQIDAYVSNPPDAIVSEATGLSYLDPPDPPHITVVISAQSASAPSDGGTTAPVVNVGVRPKNSYVRPPPAAIGGGDEGRCVSADSFLDDGTRARDAKVGDMHLCHIPGTGFEDRAIEGVGAPVLQPCVRLHLAKGGSWSGSRSTPFNNVRSLRDLEDSILAPDMAGRLVYTRRHGVLQLERVARVEDIGEQLVIPTSYGGWSFLAGDEPDVLILSHNMRKIGLD